jgi:hypothetical protein
VRLFDVVRLILSRAAIACAALLAVAPAAAFAQAELAEGPKTVIISYRADAAKRIVREGALSGYQLYMNRYSVGAPWDSLFIQRYRDFDAFGKRQQVLDKVRVGLRESPEWMGWHKRKGDIRSETENSIAELIAH